MSGIPTKRKKKNPVWICADDWVGIFPFLPPRQLGLRMAMVGDRFDRLVDGHFGTRKWTFGDLIIRGKIRMNGKKEMQIFKCVNNSSLEVLPIPDKHIPLPAKVIGFKSIKIFFLDHNVMAFLRGIRRLFDSLGINLCIYTSIPQRRRIFGLIFANIWPLIKGNIVRICFFSCQLYHLRRFRPTVLMECPRLKTVFSDNILPEFPADDSANASDARAVAKWLCTPRGDGTPKVLKYDFHWIDGESSSQIDAIKREFVNSSSHINFIIAIWVHSSVSIVPFDLINGLTGECLTLRRLNDYDNDWLMVRCPISRDQKQWAEWEKGAIDWKLHKQWNRLHISVDANAIGDGLFKDAIEAGPSGQQQKQG